MQKKVIRIIIESNLWIIFLITKDLKKLYEIIFSRKSILICSHVDEVEIKEEFAFNLTPSAKREIKKIIYQHFDLIVESWNIHFKNYLK
jgi:predicted nucleic acid-binding protein